MPLVASLQHWPTRFCFEELLLYDRCPLNRLHSRCTKGILLDLLAIRDSGFYCDSVPFGEVGASRFARFAIRPTLYPSLSPHKHIQVRALDFTKRSKQQSEISDTPQTRLLSR